MKKNDNSPKRQAIRLTKMWQDLGPNTYPLDLDLLIDGAIQSSGFGASLETQRRSFDSLDGCLVRVKKTNQWNILLNKDITNQRRLRFTHAHELGHFMCHRDQQDRFEDNSESLNDYQQDIELEANVFASWLLMPANIMRAEFGNADWNVETLSKLGNRFECSLQASALRFANISNKPLAFVVSRDGMILWGTKSKAAPFVKSFRFGDELAVGSEARKLFETGARHSDHIESGFAWNDYKRAEESQYFDTSGLGYQYTCIEFEK